MQVSRAHVFSTTVFRSILFVTQRKWNGRDSRVVNRVCSLNSQCECCKFSYYYVIAMAKNQLKHEKRNNIRFQIALWLNVFRCWKRKVNSVGNGEDQPNDGSSNWIRNSAYKHTTSVYVWSLVNSQLNTQRSSPRFHRLPWRRSWMNETSHEKWKTRQKKNKKEYDE